MHSCPLRSALSRSIPRSSAAARAGALGHAALHGLDAGHHLLELRQALLAAAQRVRHGRAQLVRVGLLAGALQELVLRRRQALGLRAARG